MTEGLTTPQVALARRDHGANSLPHPSPPAAWRRLVGEFVHFFALMLWVAALLALVAGLPALAVAIVVVVLLNGVFAFAQERRADRAAARLQALLPASVTVRRDGVERRLAADEVVWGDLVLLDPGDRVPADGCLVVSHGARADESLLTGESAMVDKLTGDRVFAGTFLVEGSAELEVDAVGAATRLGEIAHLTTGRPSPVTPLTKGLRVVVRSIALIAVSVGVVCFGVAQLLGNDARDGFVFAVGVTVALVPEALLPTVTLALAWGAEQMAKRRVLVRHLDAVETLGSTTFVCTDKTGTLTLNQMVVMELWSPTGAAHLVGAGYGPSARVELVGDPDGVASLARAAARCGTGRAVLHDSTWVPVGDPMEAAIDAAARRLGLDMPADRRDHPEAARWSFDPRRRRMAVMVDDEVIVKGAPDAVLPRCATVEAAAPALAAMVGAGLRVIAVAVRPRTSLDQADRSVEDVETDLELMGLLGLEDPPRADVADAIEACRRAGVRLAMVTGDHPDTAAAVAAEVGLLGPDRLVVVGADLPEDDAELVALLERDGVVVARVSPEQKLRIAEVLRASGHVVAMTGDGVNDAPALREADIGIAMGASGTDVAREAADLVLLDDHFASIVDGIELGRATYVNIRRFLTYHLTDNVAELTPFVVWMVSGGRFPLALGVLQILALDIGTDTLSAVALGAEPPARHVLDGPPVSGRLMNALVVRRAFFLLGPAIAAMCMLAFVVSLGVAGWRPGGAWPDEAAIAAASGAAFAAVVLGQKANVFACRSATRLPGALGWTSNRLLLATVPVELAFAALVLFVDPIAGLLDQAPPPALGWVVAVGAIPIVFGVDAADKWWRRHRRA